MRYLTLLPVGLVTLDVWLHRGPVSKTVDTTDAVLTALLLLFVWGCGALFQMMGEPED